MPVTNKQNKSREPEYSITRFEFEVVTGYSLQISTCFSIN